MLKTLTRIFLFTLLLVGSAGAQSRDGLKVFISVDMEGITGVVNADDASRGGKDYDYFRQTMTREANAAIEGALAGRRYRDYRSRFTWHRPEPAARDAEPEFKTAARLVAGPHVHDGGHR